MQHFDKLNFMEKHSGTLLGELLIAGGFVSSKDIQRLLSIQKEKNKKIGELLVEEKLIEPIELNIALEIQNKLRNPKAALKLCAGIRKRLGEILIEAKKITVHQLEEALKIQQKTGEKLGQILLNLGYIKPADLNLALLFQELSDKPIPNNLKLGEILYKNKIITKKQLDKALEIQKVFPDKKIGQILVELGYLDNEELEKGLKLQQKLILATLTGLFTIAQTLNFETLYASELSKAPSTASTKLLVSAHLKSYAKLKVLEKKSTVTITQEDIERGYKEVVSASVFEIRTNTANIYMTFEIYSNDQFYDSAIAFINDREVSLGKFGAVVLLKDVNRIFTSNLGFKFILSNNTKPGIYPIPFNISIEGL